MEIFRLSKDLVPNNGITFTERSLITDYPLHWHEFFEIEYILSGEGEFIVNNNVYDAKPNTLCFITPSDFEEIKLHSKNLVLLNIIFDSRWVSDDSKAFLEHCSVTQNYKPEILQKLFAEYENDKKYSALICKHLLSSIIVDIYRLSTPNKTTKVKFSQICDIMIYLQNHFIEDITLDSMANLAGFSPAYFSKWFHRESGQTFTDYLTTLRTTHAAMLLVTTSKSVQIISQQSGFGNFSHFLRTFKSKYNMTPSEYRENYHSKFDENPEKILHTNNKELSE